MPRATWPRLTSSAIVSLSGYWWFPAFALSASSHLRAAALPYVRATEVTMGWKAVSPPAMAILPFHWGWASCMAEVGNWLGLISDVLYTMTLTRAETPAHWRFGELYVAGVWASVDALIGDSRRLEARYCSGGEFSVKNTSAGECPPSVTIWSASTSSSSKRTLTVIPVFFSNALTNDWGVC